MGSSTTTPGVDFDVAVAESASDTRIKNLADGLRERLEDEAKLAADHAREYATHLAEGGDPLVFPKVSWGAQRNTLISPHAGVVEVYRLWNEARGGRHALVPMDGTGEWIVAEKLCETLGRPILYADLKHKGGMSTLSSDAVERIVRKIVAASDGKLVGRRTKVATKVAFLVRERRDDDPEESKYGLAEEKVEA